MPTDRRELPSFMRESIDRWVVVQENRRRAGFHNPGKASILVVHVDGGLITSGERADYIVANPAVVDVIVELKGSDTSKAINQIRATRLVWAGHRLAGRQFGALVVRGQGVSPKTTASIDRWEREFRKTFKMKLMVATRNRDYRFSEFLLPEEANA